jgi:hypothetical protein
MPVTPNIVASTGSFTFPTPGSALNTPTGSPEPLAGQSTKENRAGVQLPVAPSNTAHQPIESLNPYRAKWTICAKIDKKQPLKQGNIKGEQTSILTVVLVDTSVRGCFVFSYLSTY